MNYVYSDLPFLIILFTFTNNSEKQLLLYKTKVDFMERSMEYDSKQRRNINEVISSFKISNKIYTG